MKPAFPKGGPVFIISGNFFVDGNFSERRRVIYMSGKEREVTCLKLTKDEFAAAVTENSRAMFRTARTLLSSDADAEDAVSRAVLSAWRGVSKLRDREKIRPWLIKITVNSAYEIRRKTGRVTFLEEIPDTPAPDEHRYDDLWEAISNLPEDRRTAITLFYYDGLSVEEIAEALSLPEGTVKSRLSRARDQLRQMLKED